MAILHGAVLHGGQLSRVALQYNIPESQWLDLSTGIAPFSYLIPDIPLKIWQDLPTVSEHFLNVAKQYYQAQHCWPVSGSQALIEKLPTLWRDKYVDAKHVYLPKVGYKEHQHAWKLAGYELHFYQKNLPESLPENSVVVVINPNNPLTDTFSIEQLTQLQKRCETRHSLLIIDEAFADIFEPEFSFVSHIKEEVEGKTKDVIVLRSFGKFFGLAGSRIGFACSGLTWFEKIKKISGPWAVNGPALYIAELALQDTDWHENQKKRLIAQSLKQQSLLSKYLGNDLMNSRIETNALFITVFLDNAPDVYDLLCKKAIYVRLTDENDALRFGIADETQLARLRLLLAP